MCGIIGGIAQRDIAPILLEGLKRLEYRGYDSAGLVVINKDNELKRLRTRGKVKALSTALESQPLPGKIGIAHTRWATHGAPSENNAHPHFYKDEVAVVHNGIIENYETIKESLEAKGHQFYSDTDTEVIAYCFANHLTETNDPLDAAIATCEQLHGAFALAFVCKKYPDRVIVVRRGSPLVIGLGLGENFIASDSLALLPVTQNFVVLEEGDIAEVYQNSFNVYDASKTKVTRSPRELKLNFQYAERGEFRHFMQKEIFEQPHAVKKAIIERVFDNDIPDEVFGINAKQIFDKTKAVQIAACGTSYHAAMVAKYWIEQWANIPCQVEVASEMRYREPVVLDGTLFISLSQSGETADTLAALRATNSKNYCGRLAICNVPESSLVRESDLVLLTHAGPEIGVASTKAFTAQLVAILMLCHCLAKKFAPATASELQIPKNLILLPGLLEKTLEIDEKIKNIAKHFNEKMHALFLGRGIHYPMAKEGALKLKEISYIHAEAYPAGELKHGPLALVDKNMPVVAIMPNDFLLDKLKSNLKEVQARGGELIIFSDHDREDMHTEAVFSAQIPVKNTVLSPIIYSIPLQLLAYHVAVNRGTDVDQPRNLAKSVTVE